MQTYGRKQPEAFGRVQSERDPEAGHVRTKRKGRTRRPKCKRVKQTHSQTDWIVYEKAAGGRAAQWLC